MYRLQNDKMHYICHLMLSLSNGRKILSANKIMLNSIGVKNHHLLTDKLRLKISGYGKDLHYLIQDSGKCLLDGLQRGKKKS